MNRHFGLYHVFDHNLSETEQDSIARHKRLDLAIGTWLVRKDGPECRQSSNSMLLPSATIANLAAVAA